MPQIRLGDSEDRCTMASGVGDCGGQERAGWAIGTEHS